VKLFIFGADLPVLLELRALLLNLLQHSMRQRADRFRRQTRQILRLKPAHFAHIRIVQASREVAYGLALSTAQRASRSCNDLHLLKPLHSDPGTRGVELLARELRDRRALVRCWPGDAPLVQPAHHAPDRSRGAQRALRACAARWQTNSS